MSLDPKSSYYDAGGVQVIDVIKAKLTQEQLIGFYLGNVIKYAARLNHKGNVPRDASKLATYSALLAEAVSTPRHAAEEIVSGAKCNPQEPEPQEPEPQAAAASWGELGNPKFEG